MFNRIFDSTSHHYVYCLDHMDTVWPNQKKKLQLHKLLLHKLLQESKTHVQSDFPSQFMPDKQSSKLTVDAQLVHTVLIVPKTLSIHAWLTVVNITQLMPALETDISSNVTGTLLTCLNVQAL